MVILFSGFQPFTAETVTISITIYKEKIKTIFELSSPFFQNHFTASGSPVDFILPNFSPFLPFNRLNLWYFAIFFCFYFSDPYFIFELNSKMIFIFSSYIVIEIGTVSAVKSCNRKGECFSKRHRRQTFFEGESSSRNIR